MMQSTLAPAVALILWTFVMLIWLYATRIPAMAKLKINPQEAARTGIKPSLPPQVERVAENYNHLHEQPVLFYALCIITHLAQPTDAASGDAIALYAAWGYVGVRILHSLIQATANIILVRFLVFNVGSIVLAVLAWRAASAVF